MTTLSDLLGFGDDEAKRPSRPKDDNPADSTKAATPAASVSAQADREQQEILLTGRTELPRRINDLLAERQRIFDRQHRLIGHVHRGRWHTFWPWIKALNRLPDLAHKGVIILGGWHRQFPADVNDLTPPKKDVIETVLSYGTCAEALALCKLSSRSPSPEKEEAAVSLQKLVAECGWIFRRKLDPHLWNEGHISEALQRALPDLAQDVQYALAFMEERALVFHPSSSDPTLGWRDFFDFARAYTFLPDPLHYQFGPHFLLIKLPS